MLFALYLLFHLFRRGAVAVPLASTLDTNILSGSHPSFTPVVDPAFATRSLWNIIWDCLLTTFACSWLSVHPNVPRQEATKWSKRLLRVRYMTWAIIAPELVILWAMKQRYGAQKVADRFEGWTIEHGYLLQMGGFTLYDGTNFLGVLSFDMLEKCVHRITLDHPTLTKEAIEDKSKSDGLAKGLVTIQVTWFVIQAFARYTQDLVVTQLEIATIALGVLNGAMYIGWRKKPFNVQVPIPIYLEPAEEDIYRQGQLGARWGGQKLRMDIMTDENKQLLNVQLYGHDADDDGISDQDRGYKAPQNDNNKTPSLAYKILFVWPKDFVLATMMDVQEMSMLTASGSFVHLDRVSTFYALPVALTAGTTMSILVSIMGLVFGAIHCIAWPFNFPSFTELMIWRVSSIVVVAWIAASLIMLMAQLCFVDQTWDHVVTYIEKFNSETRRWIKVAMVIKVVFFLIITAGVPVYVIARLALLIEAFTTLRDLPPEAYRVVEWSSLIPHIFE